MFIFFKALNVFKAHSNTKVALPDWSMNQKTVETRIAFKTQRGKWQQKDLPRILSRLKLAEKQTPCLSIQFIGQSWKKILAITTKCLSPKGSQTYCFYPPTLFNISKSESTGPHFEKWGDKKLILWEPGHWQLQMSVCFSFVPKNAPVTPECCGTGKSLACCFDVSSSFQPGFFFFFIYKFQEYSKGNLWLLM